MSFFSGNKPRFSDRLRGKSGDELMDEITKEFDDENVWFDRNPFSSHRKVIYDIMIII